MNAIATEIRLADCVDLLAGFAFKSDRFQGAESGGIPLVKGENIGQGRILWDISRYWPSNENGLDKFRLLPGDVVLAMDRPWVPAGLKWAVIRDGDPDAFLVQRCARLRSRSPDLRQEFLRYVIGSPGFVSYIRPITTGVNVPHISGAQILAYTFRLPPVEQQKRIAGILSAYDDLIENCERRIRVLDEMARSLYREWFVEFRFPGNRADGGRSLPMGWVIQPLVAQVSLTMGQSPKSEFYNEVGEGIPFHQGVSDFGERFPQHRVFCTAHVRVAEKGDILFSVRAPVGRMNIAQCRLGLGRGVSALRHKAGYQAFLWEQLRAKFTREDMIGNGAIFASVTKDEMESIDMLVPSVETVRKFVDLVLPKHFQIETLQSEVSNLRATRDILLHRLLSGQLSVDDAA
jgi:type I restriction enzyme S subunit